MGMGREVELRMGMETRAGNGDRDEGEDRDRDRDEEKDSHEIGSGEVLLLQPPQRHTPAGLALGLGGIGAQGK